MRAVLAATLLSHAAVVFAAVTTAEKNALLDLYNGAGGQWWLATWPTSTDPCVPTAWLGVTCSSSPDRVVYVRAPRTTA